MTWLPCRHCSTKLAYRSRGLCHPCYLNTGIRAAYPPTDSRGRRGVGHEGWKEPCPTFHRPGSPGKLAVLAARAEAKEALWSPQDAR